MSERQKTCRMLEDALQGEREAQKFYEELKKQLLAENILPEMIDDIKAQEHKHAGILSLFHLLLCKQD